VELAAVTPAGRENAAAARLVELAREGGEGA